MALPLNPALVSTPSSIADLPQARMWVERFARPQGFSPYAWNTTKRIAIPAWARTVPAAIADASAPTAAHLATVPARRRVWSRTSRCWLERRGDEA